MSTESIPTTPGRYRVTTHDAVLRAVLENPDDDAPRLAYADLLEDAGDAASVARAEFIRVHVQFYRLFTGRTPTEIRDDAHKIADLGAAWVRWIKKAGADHVGEILGGSWQWAKVSSDRYGRNLESWHLRRVADDARASFRRGFVERIAIPLAALTEDAARALFRGHPVRSVRITDRRPVRFSDWFSNTPRYIGAWIRDMSDYTEIRTIYNGEPPEAVIPGAIFDKLDGGSPGGCFFAIRKHGDRRYDTADAADDALSRACVAWGESLRTPLV